MRDVIAPDLEILFCGINPGLYSAAAGHHFAGPGNRFWPALNGAGLTPRLLSPREDIKLLEWGLGITNVVDRATAKAALLTKQELRDGGEILVRKVERFRPRILAVVGLGAYRTVFSDPDAACGLQERALGPTRLWLLPNPSGLNAHHQGPVLVSLFSDLRQFAAGLRS